MTRPNPKKIERDEWGEGVVGVVKFRSKKGRVTRDAIYERALGHSRYTMVLTHVAGLRLPICQLFFARRTCRNQCFILSLNLGNLRPPAPKTTLFVQGAA